MIMRGSICGCGTELYGKRNFAYDGSYLTTEWVTIFFIPIIPVRSRRVKDTSNVTGGWHFVYGWAGRGFVICSKQLPSLRQVAFTYLYVIGLFTFLVAFFVVDVLPADSAGLYRLLILALAGLWSLIPRVLRRRALRKSQRQLIANPKERPADKQDKKPEDE